MKESAESFPGTRYIGHFSHWYDWGCMLYARFIVDDHVPADPDEASSSTTGSGTSASAPRWTAAGC